MTSPRESKPAMTLKSGQNARCGVVASAAAAAAGGGGDGNNNSANEDAPSTSTSNSSSSASAAAAAAIAAAASLTVDEFILSGDVVAVGPGELPAAVLSELAKRLESGGGLERVRVVAAGDAPAAEAAVAGVPQVQQSENATPDVAILQADEVDSGDLSFIACRHDDGASSSSPSGSGSGALPQPQLARVAAAASAARRGAVALARSPLLLVDRLTGDVPVAVELELMPDGSGRDWEEAAEELDDEFLGDAPLGVWRRPALILESGGEGDGPGRDHLAGRAVWRGRAPDLARRRRGCVRRCVKHDRGGRGRCRVRTLLPRRRRGGRRRRG